MVWEMLDPLLKNYENLLLRVDTHVRTIAETYRDQISCKKGCDACCRFLNLFPVEAFSLSRAFLALPGHARDRATERVSAGKDHCPLLVDGACLLYAERPVICRTHGFPLYLEKQGQAMVDFCPENFKGMTELPKDAMLDLNQLNTLLTAVNQHFIAHIDTALPDRIPVSQALFLCRDIETDTEPGTQHS